MMADLYYIEEGYYDAGYFVYTADAGALINSEFSQTCTAEMIAGGITVEATASFNSEDTVTITVNKIAGAIIALESFFTQLATISHIHGSDLFAFSEAAIAVQVDRIRDNNIVASVAFDIATSIERIQQGDADADAVFSAIINGLRSRDVTLDAQAAFSFSAVNDKIIGTSQDCQAEFLLTAQVETLAAVVECSAALESNCSISIEIFRISTANLEINSEFSLVNAGEYVRNSSATTSSEFTQTAAIDGTLEASAYLEDVTTNYAQNVAGEDSEYGFFFRPGPEFFTIVPGSTSKVSSPHIAAPETAPAVCLPSPLASCRRQPPRPPRTPPRLPAPPRRCRGYHQLKYVCHHPPGRQPSPPLGRRLRCDVPLCSCRRKTSGSV